MEPHRLGALVAQMSAPLVVSDTEQSQVIASWFDLSEPEAVASTPQLFLPFCVHHGQMTVQQQGRHLICTVMLTLVWLQTVVLALGRSWARLTGGLLFLPKQSRFSL